MNGPWVGAEQMDCRHRPSVGDVVWARGGQPTSGGVTLKFCAVAP